MKQQRRFPNFGVILFILALFIGLFMILSSEADNREPTYSQVRAMFEAEQVKAFSVEDGLLILDLHKPLEDGRDTVTKKLASFEVFYNDLHELIDEQVAAGIIEDYDYPKGYESPWWAMMIPYVLVGGLFLLIMFFLMNRAASGGGGGGSMAKFGKANVRTINPSDEKVTFRDVAGAEEEKAELAEIVDFLRNPAKYSAIGAKIPKGVLLVGPPGTGKTLIAKAVAGEAGVQFLSISGSDFVELYVGVGASRVRDLFEQAKKVAPSIVFIDEIDAVGHKRNERLGYNDQTLNSLLGEIDGFDSSKGIVILAATNRPEILDKALLRPGRFDRRIVVDRPNLQGRLDTLKVHTRKIRLAEDVDLRKLAQATAGCVGADLANLVNEAALRAVRQGRKLVTQEDLLVSFEVVIAGTEKKNTVLTETEKRLVAYHEVGHALVSALEKRDMPVSKITIVPHTEGALGYTLYLPEEEKFLSTRDELLVQLRSLLGGRAAEDVVFHTMTTGAANDIQRATGLARNMVALYGMSEELGLMAPATVTNQYLDGQSYLDCSQETSALVDASVKKMLNTCYAEAKQVLADNRALLDEIAEYLLVKETITGEELMAYVNADREKLPAPETEQPEETTENAE